MGKRSLNVLGEFSSLWFGGDQLSAGKPARVRRLDMRWTQAISEWNTQ